MRCEGGRGRLIYFSDSDCLFKLAVCDLLSETQAAFSFTQSDIQVTDEPRLVLMRQQKRFEKQWGAIGKEAHARALKFVKSCAIIQTSPDATEELILGNMFDIDAGELELICATKFAGVADFRLLTGDKKWARELHRSRAGSTVRLRLNRRCLHFEQILLKVIEAENWPRVRDKLIPAVGCDQKLLGDKVFLEGYDTRKVDAMDRLKESITRLHADTGELFEITFN